MSFWPRALIPSPNRIPKEPQRRNAGGARGSPGSGWARWESLGQVSGSILHGLCVSRTPLILIFLARPTRSVLTTLGASSAEA